MEFAMELLINSLMWLIEGITREDPSAQMVLVNMVLILTIAIADDLWRNRNKDHPRPRPDETK
jgi:hypothetical protein